MIVAFSCPCRAICLTDFASLVQVKLHPSAITTKWLSWEKTSAKINERLQDLRPLYFTKLCAASSTSGTEYLLAIKFIESKSPEHQN